eukprot:jgi/Chrzof1/3795/Cz13g09040.t1
MVALQNDVEFYPIITVGEAAPNGYIMAGIPDGLGAYDNDNSIIPESEGICRDDDEDDEGGDHHEEDGVKTKDTFTVLMNHEIPNINGTVRSHGAIGAFVSEWVIDKRSLGVLSGEDLIRRVYLWNETAWILQNQPPFAFDRFCSADLPSQSAIYNQETCKGSSDMIFFNGEEVDGGRAWGHVATGTFKGNSYELFKVGRGSWENVVLNPHTGDKTLLIAISDGQDMRMVVYMGNKNSNGTNPVERAGLNNGALYSVLVNDSLWVLRAGTNITEPVDPLPAGYCAPFTLVDQPLDTYRTGSGFARPEDGAWDPNNKFDFYFQSTAAINASSRLWKLRFNEDFMSGTICMVIEGPAAIPTTPSPVGLGPKMLDNLGVSKDGDIVMEEDTGNNTLLARLWHTYADASKQGNASLIAQHNPAVFNTSTSGIDEESSGVLPVDRILGEGMWLLDVQAHSLNRSLRGTELVEGGQLLAMYLGR